VATKTAEDEHLATDAGAARWFARRLRHSNFVIVPEIKKEVKTFQFEKA